MINNHGLKLAPYINHEHIFRGNKILFSFLHSSCPSSTYLRFATKSTWHYSQLFFVLSSSHQNKKINYSHCKTVNLIFTIVRGVPGISTRYTGKLLLGISRIPVRPHFTVLPRRPECSAGRQKMDTPV